MNTKRELQFELLRILLMMMIVGLHTLYFGGVLTKLPQGRTLFLAYGIESLFAPAVNCFVLISGYFSIGSVFRWKKFFTLWGQILFYSVLFSGLYYIGIGRLPSFGDTISAFSPIVTQRWWFASAFLPLYLVSGYLNKLLNGLSKKEWHRLLLIGFILFVLWSSLRPFSLRFFPLVNADGYSFLFFLFLYAVGGYLKRYFSPNIPAVFYLLGYVGCCAVTLLLSYRSRLSSSSFEISALFFGYDTLWVFTSALFLFLFFSRLTVRAEWIGLVSPLAFGIYLIHEHPHVRPVLYPLLGWDRIYLGADFAKHFCYSVLIVFFVGIITEWIRVHVIFRPAAALFSTLFKKESRLPLAESGETQAPHERIHR